MDESGGWCTIESDPGVFTELIEQLGVTGMEIQEIVGLDESSMSTLGEVYGLIFLFKHQSVNQVSSQTPACPEGMFFAKQVVPNACATQAILSVLLNLPETDRPVNIGSTLTEFKEFALGLDPESRGFAIGSSEPIKTLHNSFRPHVSLEIGHDDSPSGEAAFHFVSYIWYKNNVYELDGLKSGPTPVAPCSNRSHWLPLAIQSIQERIANYGTEIRFNLLALVQDSRIGASPEALEEVSIRRARWARENARRRHDFVPLGLACLETLAEQGVLMQLFQQVRQ